MRSISRSFASTGAMTAYILIFVFTLANGEQVMAQQDAVHLEEYRPVRTLKGCQQVALEREARMNRGFVDHPGLVQTVRISCKPATRRQRKKQ